MAYKFRNRTVYRGTQRLQIEGVRGALSWAFSLPVAIIWSANPETGPAFTPTSTVRVGRATAKKPLVMGGSGANFMTLAELLGPLRYARKNGITDDEVHKVIAGLHRRLTRPSRGGIGTFNYRVTDGDGEPIDEDDLPFSFDHRFQQTAISMFLDEWEMSSSTKESMALSEHLTVDAFAFADSKTVQEAARRLGFDAMIYDDVFQGGPRAARALLGVEDVLDLDGVDEVYDLDEEEVIAHSTYRPLTESAIEVTEVMSAVSAVERWRATAEGRAYGRSQRIAGRRR